MSKLDAATDSLHRNRSTLVDEFEVSEGTLSKWSSGALAMGLDRARVGLRYLCRVGRRRSALIVARRLLEGTGFEVSEPLRVHVVKDLADEAADLHDLTGGGWHLMRKMDADGIRDADELDQYEHYLDQVEAELAENRAALAAARGLRVAK